MAWLEGTLFVCEKDGTLLRVERGPQSQTEAQLIAMGDDPPLCCCGRRMIVAEEDEPQETTSSGGSGLAKSVVADTSGRRKPPRPAYNPQGRR